MGVNKSHIKYSNIDVGHPDSTYFSNIRSKRTGEVQGRNLFAIESI